ncbi:hypothetical protein LSCM1_01883 [Leishmania martiniquensis]|uniref:Uncharacterized protein n=1 Tax=Leishmania martiniquensis TaxID=1580590 RepID=A0A836FWK4_9TRYP|nr:hypothetical protein LSCM1_01883 [Leishmania martiniquensis]
MSWVRVECSGGHRYAAPSHGRLVPSLEGMALLFQPPFRLRQLHTFSTLTNSAPAISGRSNSDANGVRGTDESMNSCVMVDQRDLGGRLGLTTVAVGDEEDTEMTESSPLRLLLDRVFAVLCITNERGVQVLLDALCTRAPPPLTSTASAEAAIVREDDGRRRVPPTLWLERAKGVGVDLLSNTGSAVTSSNRQFLMKLTQGCSAIEGVEGSAGQLSLQPLLSDAATGTTSNLAVGALAHVPCATASVPIAHSSTALSKALEPASLVTRPPLSYAAALRRRSLLYFLPQGVVPLSLLAVRLQLSTPSLKYQGKAANALGRSDDAATESTTRVLRAVLLEGLEHVRIGAAQAGGCRKSGCACCASAQAHGGAPLLHCISHLRRQNDRLLKGSSSWAAVARTAEESGRVLVWAIARLLAGSERPMPTRQAADLERLILHDLWALTECKDAEAAVAATTDGLPSAPFIGAAPLVAVYSPSGLLLASARFSKLLSHEEQVLLAATAIDRLARFAAPRPFSRRQPPAPAADAIRWTSWPMRLGESAAKLPCAVVVDVLLITVGDALAFCLAFPRTVGSASASPLTSLQLVESLLESSMAKARSQSDAPSTVMTAPLAPAFVSACTHSTAPYTPAFHDALFAVTAIEDALDRARKPSSGDLADSVTDEQLRVAQHLHRLILREAPQLGGPSTQGGGAAAAANAPASTAGEEANPRQANANTAAAASPFRGSLGGGGRHPGSVTSALHKIFSCLPMRHSDPSKGVASSRQLYITAAQQQSNTYVSHVGKGGHLLSPIPVLNAELTQSGNPYITYLLVMPLEEMLCYVSALVTRNEVGVLRPSYELGLHSFFFIQRPAAAAGRRHRNAAEAKTSSSQARRKKNAAAKPPAPPTQFAVSFARFRLQQSPCPHAVMPEEWADADGVPDGSGGRLAFFEDPALLLRLHTHRSPLAESTADVKGLEGGSSEAACGAADPRPNDASLKDLALETQVSVVPVWALLQVAPVESFATRELGDSDTETSDPDSDSDFAAAAAAESFRGVHRSVPPSAEEDAQLVTSLHYAYPQRFRRCEPPLSPLQAAPSTTPPASPQKASSLPSPNAQPPEDSTRATAPNAASSRRRKASATRTCCQVEAVIAVCGDITGARESIVTRALQRHALSTSAEEQLMGRDHEHGSRKDAVASSAVLPNSLPVEWEYAVDAPQKMVDLCRELVWCQEAALALLEGASCAT